MYVYIYVYIYMYTYIYMYAEALIKPWTLASGVGKYEGPAHSEISSTTPKAWTEVGPYTVNPSLDSEEPRFRV